MNPYVLALNVLVLVSIGLIVAVVRYRGSRPSRGNRDAAPDLPTSMRPNRPGHELADVVTEWAQVTGVLTTEATGEASTDGSSHRGSEG